MVGKFCILCAQVLQTYLQNFIMYYLLIKIITWNREGEEKEGWEGCLELLLWCVRKTHYIFISYRSFRLRLIHENIVGKCVIIVLL